MTEKISYEQYITQKIETGEISKSEGEIISGFIGRRKSTKNTSHATQKKHVYNAIGICRILHANNATLDKCTGDDLFKVVQEISNTNTQNSRQTKITILKSLAKYIDQWHHEIPDLIRQLDDVKAGSAERNTKEILTYEEWEKVLNTPMSAKDRAIIAMMYDGYHRPMEILTLKWSDLKVTKKGIEYRIKFKTNKKRTVLQKKETTAILELWRQELGAEYGTDPRPVFPDKDGMPYKTITPIKVLFQELREKTGIKKLVPSMIRNTAITHDVESELPLSYICLRAWGDTYNDLINIYADPNSSRLQADVQSREDHNIKTMRKRKIESVMICPYCNTVNMPNARFCSDCCSPLTEDAKQIINLKKNEIANNLLISQELFNEMLEKAKSEGRI